MNKQQPIQLIDFTKSQLSYVIEASAGTGKTWTIERLFVKALLQQSRISIEKFLVVTFTNDAVNELTSRILAFINELLNNLLQIKNNPKYKISDIFIKDILNLEQSLDKTISILNSAIQNFDNSSIYTIHGFCKKVISDYQFELNITSNFKLMKDRSLIIEELLRNFVREKIINNKAFTGKISIVYDNLDKISSKLKNSSKSDYLSQLISLFNKKNILYYSKGRFSLMCQVLDNPDLSILTIDINKLDKKDSASKTLINNMALNLFSSIAKYIEHNFTKYYRKNNILSFDDLIDIVADGLNNNQQLANQLYLEYPVIFIDEFQDTDNRQWQIFCNIFQLHANKRGHVVVVGDPKQAIYKFRGADINVYLEARNTINNTLTLDENRRSHPEIINFINQLFSQEINPDSFGYGIYYYNLHAKVAIENLENLPTKNQLSAILTSKSINIDELDISDKRIQIITAYETDKNKRTEKLDFMMISEILLLLNYNPQLAGKMAILVTQNAQAKRIVDLLEQYGVKASLYKRENIFTTTTAYDLYKILVASSNLSNTKAIRQALATNLFNIPYTELINFIDSSNQIFIGENILERFFKYKLAISKNDILSMIYQLIDDLNKVYKHYNVALTNRTLANLIQLGELINKNCSLMKSSAEMLFWFNKKIDNANNDEPNEVDIDGINEELVRLDNDELQIKVITQHKSKGLEFDILFCPEFKKNIYTFSELRKLADNNSLGKLFDVEFLTYQNTQHTKIENKLTDDENIHQLYNLEEINEINRLNYVALTRVKSRIYIYLANFNVNKNGIEYSGSAKYEYIHKLFGLNPLDATDNKHKLFNYANFFIDPANAIKDPQSLPGVIVRKANLIDRSTLKKLGLVKNKELLQGKINDYVSKKHSYFNFIPQIYRQSYTSLTKLSHLGTPNNYLFDETNVQVQPIINQGTLITYRYSILNQLKGADFGILIHSLCEQYPLTREKTIELLTNTNLSPNYCDELMNLINELFAYNLLGENSSLAKIKNKINELEFNLYIKNSISIQSDIGTILSRHYGDNHPYTQECKKLDKINAGFLSGFIDVCLEYNGKYYVLDYKTNSIGDYTSCNDINMIDNSLLVTTAKNQYYLQYLLYLVVIKRYLEQKLNIVDASDFLGGAIYYYVRGIFVESANQGGVLVDSTCISVVKQLDKLFVTTNLNN